MKKKILVVSLVLLLGSLYVSNEAFAAWTQAKGHAYNQLTYSFYVTDKKFTTLGSDYDNVATHVGGGVKRLETAKFTSEGFTYYGEYGITDTLTVYTAIPWKRAKSEDVLRYTGERGPSGIGDINFGLRYNLFKNLLGSGVVTSLQGEVKIPEAYKYGNPLKDLSLGDGQYDGTLAVLFSRGIGKGWAVLTVGYKYRMENSKYYTFKPSDQFKVTISTGYSLTPKLQLRGIIDWAKSAGNASVSDEIVIDNYMNYAGKTWHKEDVLIRDTLSLEADSLNAGLSLAYTLTKECWPKCIQVVLSYNQDLEGIDVFESVNYSLGETYSLALVYIF